MVWPVLRRCSRCVHACLYEDQHFSPIRKPKANIESTALHDAPCADTITATTGPRMQAYNDAIETKKRVAMEKLMARQREKAKAEREKAKATQGEQKHTVGGIQGQRSPTRAEVTAQMKRDQSKNITTTKSRDRPPLNSSVPQNGGKKKNKNKQKKTKIKRRRNKKRTFKKTSSGREVEVTAVAGNGNGNGSSGSGSGSGSESQPDSSEQKMLSSRDGAGNDTEKRSQQGNRTSNNTNPTNTSLLRTSSTNSSVSRVQHNGINTYDRHSHSHSHSHNQKQSKTQNRPTATVTGGVDGDGESPTARARRRERERQWRQERKEALLQQRIQRFAQPRHRHTHDTDEKVQQQQQQQQQPAPFLDPRFKLDASAVAAFQHQTVGMRVAGHPRDSQAIQQGGSDHYHRYIQAGSDAVVHADYVSPNRTRWADTDTARSAEQHCDDCDEKSSTQALESKLDEADVAHSYSNPSAPSGGSNAHANGGGRRPYTTEHQTSGPVQSISPRLLETLNATVSPVSSPQHRIPSTSNMHSPVQLLARSPDMRSPDTSIDMLHPLEKNASANEAKLRPITMFEPTSITNTSTNANASSNSGPKPSRHSPKSVSPIGIGTFNFGLLDTRNSSNKPAQHYTQRVLAPRRGAARGSNDATSHSKVRIVRVSGNSQNRAQSGTRLTANSARFQSQSNVDPQPVTKIQSGGMGIRHGRSFGGGVGFLRPSVGRNSVAHSKSSSDILANPSHISASGSLAATVGSGSGSGVGMGVGVPTNHQKQIKQYSITAKTGAAAGLFARRNATSRRLGVSKNLNLNFVHGQSTLVRSSVLGGRR